MSRGGHLSGRFIFLPLVALVKFLSPSSLGHVETWDVESWSQRQRVNSELQRLTFEKQNVSRGHVRGVGHAEIKVVNITTAAQPHSSTRDAARRTFC